jgi:hypothetical protein
MEWARPQCSNPRTFKHIKQVVGALISTAPRLIDVHSSSMMNFPNYKELLHKLYHASGFELLTQMISSARRLSSRGSNPISALRIAKKEWHAARYDSISSRAASSPYGEECASLRGDGNIKMNMYMCKDLASKKTHNQQKTIVTERQKITSLLPMTSRT